MSHLTSVSSDKIVLSPFQITQQMVSGRGQFPLLAFHSSMEQCFDGILRHLGEYEEVGEWREVKVRRCVLW